MQVTETGAMVNGEPVRIARVELTFQAIDTEEYALDCDGCGSNQAAWITFTHGLLQVTPAIVFCHECLAKFEAHGVTQQESE